ncbi:class I SAM-dependent methyltransferase [Lysobacter arenosi]|uniref:Class I SAM-dependent methyltransferase n=1 Tax=Lysobacter arenosi TaxID=2795387 RepID=A0ABX7RCG5_9GAMM|nr:class I SAM-dependent methyltransferase [Lysobacter arenosi]QSX74591.1 class I SAM-dependent methyltransferase [Lysobacter arenosi]
MSDSAGATTHAATAPLPGKQARALASAFLPREHWYGRRDYYYAWSKFGTDPLYPGVCEALRGTQAPLLDMGCGLGLLAHALRADGQRMPYRGYDNDVSKILRARKAAARCDLGDVAFETADLAQGMPAHRGSVAVLDVLQFVPVAAQMHAIDQAIAMLTPGAKLVIRTGLADGSHRAHVTRFVDVFAKVVGWMNAAPLNYPDADAVRARLADAGLKATFTSLRGRTPFNNWLIIAG